jgi:hypothetical protein
MERDSEIAIALHGANRRELGDKLVRMNVLAMGGA